MGDGSGIPAGMSIADLADRTGVAPATLRSWEARYGVPTPARSAGGHRRYDERQVGRVEELLALRKAGLSMAAAAERVGSSGTPGHRSLFAGLRERHARLRPQVLRKSTLLALTWALEDELSARAEQPRLYASFQNRDQYRTARPRWTELTRVAVSTVIFSDFDTPPRPGDSPVCVPVPADSPLRREWAVICDSPTYPACLAGWQLPTQNDDASIWFETVWSVEPRVVADAADLGRTLAETYAPQLVGTLTGPAADTAPAASADLRRASGLLDRMLGYLDNSTPRRP